MPRVDDRGYLRRPELTECLARASIAVVPSIWPDPCPAVAVEAMGSGAAVIASSTGGLPEILEHGRAGLLVRPGDPAELAAALHRLLEDEGLRRRLAGSGRASAEQYSAEVVLPQIERVYEAAIDETRS